MSRIDELIAQHCPDGVEFRSVGAASVPVRMPGKVKREDYGLGSAFPIVDQSLDYIAGYTDEQAIIVPEAQYVVFGDHTRAVKFIDFAFAQGADGVKVLQAAHDLSTKWLYYCVSSLDVPSRGYNRHWTVLRDLRIPVPPRAIQQEIVRILDRMEGLRPELQAELTKRQRQYEYYRDALLSFADRERVPWMPLSKLGSPYPGLAGKRKADFSNGNARFVSYMNVFNNPATNTEPADLVVVAPGERQNRVRYGDILFTASSETVEEVGMSSAVAQEPTEPLYLNSFCFGFRPNTVCDLKPRFAKHLFRSAEVRRQIIRTANGVTRINISKPRFGDVEIPVPSIDEQEHLADILDKFDALVSDSSIGLPAELRARRQQYEHYRDRLLTFPEAA